MKNILFFLIACAGSAFYLSVFSQNQNEPVALGLPGDNLNLYAVLDVFQKSPTLESFEREINDRNNKINNLDLNKDNVIDYIEVSSQKNGNSHSIVLQTAINSKEYQDIAVIEVHKNRAGKVLVQIIGDKDLYGNNYVIEPSSPNNISETPNPGYSGTQSDSQNVTVNNYYNGIYYANDWPIIAFLYSPGFSLYISPWHYGYYPSYWSPWEPIGYYDYWGYHDHYYHDHYYRRSPYIRYPNHYYSYSERRNYSPTVLRYRETGRYNATYAGRTYNRPAAPVPQPSRAAARSVAPQMRSTGQAAPSNRSLQQSRPTRTAPNPGQVARPAAGTTPQASRTAPQTTRTTAPPAQQRQSFPARQSMPSTRPISPMARPSMPAERSSVPMQSSPSSQSERQAPMGRR